MTRSTCSLRLLFGFVLLLLSTRPALADVDGISSILSEVALPSTSGKPYTSRIQLDTRAPVTYGDDAVISVWVSPTEGFDLNEVRLHPKGVLTSLYAVDETTEDGMVPGVPCRTSVQRGRIGIPFVATCRMTSIGSGLQRVFNWKAVPLAGGLQQFEVEVVLADGIDDEARYYEFGSLEFASPLFSVVLGGILGAGLWALFLPVSTPLPTIPTAATDGWRVMARRVAKAAPQIALRWTAFAASVIRSAVLGGATALVLIILARTTEGMDTPIALEVNDLWGGLLVGIFSAPLSKWIRKKVETTLQAQ